MYWKPGDFPSLKALPRKEQLRIVSSAIRKAGKTTNLRFFVALVLAFAAPVVVGNIESLPIWSGLVVAGLAGLSFYVYLLWEINGPIFRAVNEFLSDGNTA